MDTASNGLSADEPILVSIGNVPCFRGKDSNTENLFCSGDCGNVLIRGYNPEAYCSITFKCLLCGTLTRTPSALPGEVFSSGCVVIGQPGMHLVASTIQAAKNVIFTTSKEIKKTLDLTSPRDEKKPLEIDMQSIQEALDKYDELSGGKLNVTRSIALKGRKSAFVDFPFVFAIEHLKERIQENLVNIDDPQTQRSVLCYILFTSMVRIWGHHPRFALAAHSIGQRGEFFHTAFLMLALRIFYAAGYQIGISTSKNTSCPNPDLYMRHGTNIQLYIEVKCPVDLQFSSQKILTVPYLEILLKKRMKLLSGQINRNHPGVLVIGSSSPQNVTSHNTRSVIHSYLLRHGRRHPYLSSIIFLCAWVRRDHAGSFGMASEAINFDNPHYSGLRQAVSENATV